MQITKESTLPVHGRRDEIENESRVERLFDNGVPLAGCSRDRRAMHKLCFFDLLVVWISGGTACGLEVAWRRNIHNPSIAEFFGPESFGFLFLFSILVVLFGSMHGLYDSPWKRRNRKDLKLLAKSVASAAVVAALYFHFESVTTISKATFMLTAGLAWSVMSVWRKFIHPQTLLGATETRNILIVGPGRAGRLLKAHLERNPDLGYVVKGFLNRRRTARPGEKPMADLLGTVDQLPSIARAHFIDEIFISVPQDRHLVKEIARLARAAKVQVRVIPDLYDGLAMAQPVEYIGCFPTLTVNKSPIPRVARVLKRLGDIAASAIALVTLMPVFAVVALIIKLDSEGPVFYSGLRVGKKGKTFRCHKFRTMVENADALQASLGYLNERDKILFKITNDPRVTRAGRYLRRFSLDEIPQFWNVLKGEMSLVGPRPAACSEYAHYDLEHLCRLEVTPGITGLWQVAGRLDPSFDSYISLDREYVNNWSLGLDWKILCKTVGTVLAGTGQ
jgi:exopolysaccharide biosynthesis polyprenyl glycosylphosphotransferase